MKGVWWKQGVVSEGSVVKTGWSVRGVWWKQGVVSEGSVVETGCGQ